MPGTGTGDLILTTMENGAVKSLSREIVLIHCGKEGDIRVTHDGSIDVDELGVLATSKTSSGNGDVTITHGDKITTEEKGLNLKNTGTGDITVTTGESSMITADDDNASTNADDGIYAYSEAGNTGDITVTHGSTITGGNAGINLLHEGIGKIMVATEKDGMITAEVAEGIYAEGKTGLRVTWRSRTTARSKRRIPG